MGLKWDRTADPLLAKADAPSELNSLELSDFHIHGGSPNYFSVLESSVFGMGTGVSLGYRHQL